LAGQAGGMTDTQYLSIASGNMFTLLLGLKADPAD
jgi:hypothetical protein